MQGSSICSPIKRSWLAYTVLVQEESYTSKASFLDLDPIPVYGEEDADKATFSGRRVKRGMYKASNQAQDLNADINGSYNIMRKALPNVFTDNGIEDVNKTICVFSSAS